MASKTIQIADKLTLDQIYRVISNSSTFNNDDCSLSDYLRKYSSVVRKNLQKVSSYQPPDSSVRMQFTTETTVVNGKGKIIFPYVKVHLDNNARTYKESLWFKIDGAKSYLPIYIYDWFSIEFNKSIDFYCYGTYETVECIILLE